MVHSEVSHQALIAPPEVSSGGYFHHDRAEITAGPYPPVEQRHSVPARVARWLSGAAFTGMLLASGAHPAQAAPAETIMAQAESQESGFDWGVIPHAITALSVAVAAVAIVRQTKEKTADRFNAALQGIKGESTGEERGARLRVLEPYTESRKYAPQVFKTSREYLRGRRGGLEILRKQHKDSPDELEHAIRERRNADRSALGLFLATLPAARQQLRRQEIANRIKKMIGRSKDGLQALDDLTGIRMDGEKPRVDARAINLDDMRDLKRCDLQGVDLTGAGLQRIQVTSVVLRDTRLCEAQFEGTTVSRSDLREADLRAAYLHGATFENCVIDKDTKFGNLPDAHPDARLGSLDPDHPDKYRGNTEVILKNLISATLSPEQIVQVVRGWQQQGLTLLAGSTPEYFLNPPKTSPEPDS
jgi:hypothetical protein